MPSHQVFLSYSSQDRETADKICSAVEEAGIHCWMAPRDIQPGMEWGTAIIEAIEACRIMVLLYSQNSNQSSQVLREVERAVAKKRPVITVRLENAAPSKGLEYFISASHWLDAVRSPASAAANDVPEGLIDSIRALLPPPPQAPSAPAFPDVVAEKENHSHATGPLHLTIKTDSGRIEKRIEGAALNSYIIGRGTDANLFLNDSGISRRHCRIFANGDRLEIEDAGSSGGTFVNGARLVQPTVLHDGDEIVIGGVNIAVKIDSERVSAAAQATKAKPPPPARQRLAPRRPAAVNPDATIAAPSRSAGFSGGFSSDGLLASAMEQPPQGNISVPLVGDSLVIGRDASCELTLESLIISRQHTRLFRSGGGWMVEDLGSTNGTFLNDRRLSDPRRLAPGDALGIGPYCLIFDGSKLVSERPETGAEITLSGLSHEVTDRETGRPKMLLRDISFTIRPRQFVGLLGTSGAGKSTFVSAISGRRPATHGDVLLNGENLYTRFEALKAGIGFVPQDVIFHDGLPLIEALRYTSRLRLSNDATDEEIEANLERVLKTVGLNENRGTIIKNLSGGQKKRVSIAMELLSQPRILFLDEVTSGLDPRTEKQMMKLFRDLADSGITVICITHYANSVEICDQIVYLNKGLLSFYGSPAQFKEYFGVEQIEAAYDKEEHKTPAQWQAEFRKSDFYEDGTSAGHTNHQPHRPAASQDAIDWPQLRRQLSVFTRRYVRVLSIDRRNLLLLLGLPPLTAALLCILSSSMETPSAIVNREAYGAWAHKQKILCFGPIIIMFLLSMFGSVREIVKELSIYHHERFINLRILPYLLSKIGPLVVIGAIQTFSVVFIINCFADMHAGNVMSQFVTLFLVSVCGTLAGLAISASVKSSDWAVMLMIGLVIPQLLFAGALVPVRGASEFIAKGFISAYWALEALRSSVEEYYRSNQVGTYVLTDKSQGWAVGTGMLLVHAIAFAGLTFFLLARKDGPGAASRIAESLKVLWEQLTNRRANPLATVDGSDAGRQRARGAGHTAVSPVATASKSRAYEEDATLDHADRSSRGRAGGRRDRRPSATMHRVVSFLIGGLVGLLLGYPISYFAQPGALRAKVSLDRYITGISDIFKHDDLASTAIGTWIACVVGFAVLGLLLSVIITSGRRTDS